MPTVLQASISSVPAGAVTFLPSTVSVTSAISSAGVPPAVARASRPRCQEQSKFCGLPPAPRAGETPALRHHFFRHALLFIGAGLTVEMVLKFFSEFLYERNSRH